MYIIGIDIGGTNFRIGLVDEAGHTARLEKVPVGSVFSSHDPLADLSSKIKTFGAGTSCQAVAIGFPATLNADRTRVVQAPNIPFMEDLPVCEVLQKELGIPVLAEKDVTFALCYDMEKYQIPAEGLTCGIYFGTGIGNAMAFNGVPWTGAHGAAGELGHIPVDGSREPCGCGCCGCIETVAGGKVLARIQKEQYPDTPIEALFTRYRQEPALQQVVERMAMAVATEINLLDPSHVLLGGGVLNMPDFPREELTRQILSRVRQPLPRNVLDLRFTEDERDKSVVGGALYARRKLARSRV